MQLFYTPELSGNRYTLTEEESKHCIRVLRMGEGDQLNLTDGKGTMFTARIVLAHPKRCEVEITDRREEFGKRPFTLWMAVAPTKNMDRFEFFIEKATEIGVDRVIPLECEHSERRAVKRERAEKIVTGAVKQSLKAYHPQMDEMIPFGQAIAFPFDGDKFIAHCSEDPDKTPLKNLVVPGRDVFVLIGPEGDFSEKEIEAARRNGFRPVSLGKCRLRTETAALAACHTVNLMNED